MKRFLILFLVILMFIPSISVKAKTISDLRRELQEIEERKSENNTNIYRTNEQIEQAKREIVNNNTTIQNINVEIKNLDEKIRELEEDIVNKDKTTKNLMASLQTTNGNSFYIEYLFGADSITDFIYRYSITEQITNYNEKLIREMNEMIEESEKKQVELAHKQEDLKNKQQELESQVAKLNQANVRFYELQTDIEDEIRNAKQIIQMYLDAGCEENEDIKTCANKLLPADTKFWRPFAPGYITSGYGYRSAIYVGNRLIASAQMHEGIDISNGYGSSQAIYSVANGKVVAVWYDQWGGNQLTIHHNINGKSYSSSYAHMSRVVVRKGDIVTKDTVVGYMGSTGSATGPHLHLAISTGLRFTEYTGYNAYVSRTVDPRTLINFPSSGSWNDRIYYYK